MSALVCKHDRTSRDGESYWCEDCGAFLPAGTSEWRVPQMAGIVDLQTRALLAVTQLPGFQHQIGMWEEIGPLIERALTAAGLDTQEKRDAAREAMRGGR